MLRGSALLIITLLAAMVVGAGSAAATGYYPTWTKTPSGSTAQSYEGTVDFNLRGFPNADWVTRKAAADGQAIRLYSSAPDCNASGVSCEWMTSATPFGAVFGASGPSESIRFLSQRLAVGNQIDTTYTFARAVPARAKV